MRVLMPDGSALCVEQEFPTALALISVTCRMELAHASNSPLEVTR